jgi:hypothetical protein
MSIRRCAGLAALVVAVGALTPPAIALGEAGDSCGAVTAAQPGAVGTVTVAAGTLSCADALAVVNRYLTDPSVERGTDGGWVHFDDGWDCWEPSAGEKVVNAFVTECSRGGDDVQVRH